ncbi:unnamed protein product, partial [Aphanomyces euteiches]
SLLALASVRATTIRVLHGSREELEMIATGVDDFLVFASTEAKADMILDQLETKMKLKRQGGVILPRHQD